MDMETLHAPLSAVDAPETKQETITKAPPEVALWKQLKPIDWAMLGVFALMCVPFFQQVWAIWTAEEAPQSYALLILPAALFMAWMLRGRLEGILVRGSFGGQIVLAIGIGLLFLGTLINSPPISGVGFVLAIVGLVLGRYGTHVARKLWFPLAFLIAMIPLPSEILNVITFPLQGISVKWAALLLQPLGNITVQGTRIHMENYVLDVVAPCSGLTIVLPLFILTTYYIYIVAAPTWKKLLMIALTLPISMVVNAFRVAITGLAGDMYGDKAGEAVHDYGGLVTVMVGFAVLYFIAQELKCHRLSDEITL